MINTYFVIVTYNAMPWLDKCLGSIDFYRYKAVVIDNNSKDETVSHIKANFPEVILFEEKENLGFGKANNKGINYALEQGAEYFFLLNQDAWVKPDTIDNLCDAAKKYPEYGILSPIHLSGKGYALDYGFSNYITPVKCKDLYSDIYFINYTKEIYELEFVNAAAWLLTRNCIETVGGFSPSFFHYAEDANYCQRVIFHGLKIGIAPQTIIHHDREQRTENKYFEDFKIVQKRIAVLQLSSPFSKKGKLGFFLWVLKTMVRIIISKDAKFTKVMLTFFRIYKEIDSDAIIRCRELSKLKGKSFL